MDPKRVVEINGIECETLVEALKWSLQTCIYIPYEPYRLGGCNVKSAIFKDGELIWEEDEAK